MSSVIYQHDPSFDELICCRHRTDLSKDPETLPLRFLGGQRAPEQQDVWLWLVDHVVHPSLALLDPQVPPFRLRH